MAEETQKVAEEAKVEAPVQEAPKAEAPAKKTSLNASVAPDKFDWDAFEGGAEIYGGEDKKSIEDAYDQTLSKIVENEVVEGTVTAISKREVIVNILSSVTIQTSRSVTRLRFTLSPQRTRKASSSFPTRRHAPSSLGTE